ncbi:MAG: XRE family transcriptional regulator [Candidatus Moeniiplasma glomeromycotorum]|nr:XRE family transcriptional regulator [Candidatus Moeniiplasma glomeromycotorum]MCE8167453.1 XRE family transcriptional regulator [Candidatus Moeniiplasma glomeromycotorum]MCE8168533.1 XRE family transcriptional regulator [Candidatus Moeniiplasma glomeromycotorum]
MNDKKTQEDKEFKKFLQKIEDPKKEKEINRSLSPNATPLQVAKHKLCKQMLSYQIRNNLTDKEITKRLDLSQAETEEILFCEIERFTLDRLMTYANRLFSPNEIEVIVEEKKTSPNARTT